jgi:lysophospholipase L1-like esterase
MTLNQVTQRMRKLGIKTSETRIGIAIQNGQYPWAICIPGEKNKCYEIYTKLFEQWVDERATLVSESGETA